jgi:hypothetical protein
MISGLNFIALPVLYFIPEMGLGCLEPASKIHYPWKDKEAKTGPLAAKPDNVPMDWGFLI